MNEFVKCMSLYLTYNYCYLTGIMHHMYKFRNDCLVCDTTGKTVAHCFDRMDNFSFWQQFLQWHATSLRDQIPICARPSVCYTIWNESTKIFLNNVSSDNATTTYLPTNAASPTNKILHGRSTTTNHHTNTRDQI